MKKKRVLIIEDEQLQRESLHQALERRGFEVETAANSKEARAVVARQTEPFDVVVLDMFLGEDEEVTGADLGIEFRRQYWQHWPPEFLIISGHTRGEYLRLALDLGVAAYIEKKEDLGIERVIQLVRALALRHGLSIERKDALQRIQSIAAESRGQSEAIKHFCKEILAEELVSCLGRRFMLLMTAGGETLGLSPVNSFPEGTRQEYKTIQALTYGRAESTKPFVLDNQWVESLAPAGGSSLFPMLLNAVFVPLTVGGDLCLSLGILPEVPGIDEDIAGLGQILAKYFQPAVLKHLLTLTAMLAEMQARQMAVLKTTSQFCLYLGQEQLTTLEAAEDAGEVIDSGRYVRKMQFLADDLCRAGELLGNLAESQEPGAAAWKYKRAVSMRETVDHAWQKVSRLVGRQQPGILALDDGDCWVFGRPSYLEIATSRVLQWFVQRLAETPSEVAPKIHVRFVQKVGESLVLFEDQSRRLTDRLRQFLFVPLSQAVSRPPAGDDLEGPGVHLPLYVAKTLVEFGNDGSLEDRSTTLEGGLGHRLVMSFPEAKVAQL